MPAQAAFPGTNGKIAFTAASNIQAVNPDGSGLTNLTAGQGENFHPAWSADGRKLAFSSRRDGNFEIYVMNADGSDQVRLTSDPATDAEPSWSPDGRIVFESNRDGSYELYVMNADGSNQVRLTNTPQNEASPAWSPDGQKVAFQDSGSGGIVVMNADGSGRTQLGTIGTFMPNWSPDGREIWSWWEYYDPIAEETFSDLASYDLQTGTDRQGFFIDTWASMPAVSPDNREVVHTLNGELWVMARTGVGRRVAPIGDDPDWQPIPAPRRSDYKSAAKFCKAEEAFWGDQFASRYGGGANAYGKCVSQSH